MYSKADRTHKTLMSASAVAKRSAFQLKDNREQAKEQQQLVTQMQQRSDKPKETSCNPTTFVIQRAKKKKKKKKKIVKKKKKKVDWSKKATIKNFERWLRKRAERRAAKGKRKTSWKLVKKYIRARQIHDKNWKPFLADAPNAGHHVPPLALANKHKGKFVFGKRGSPEEKARKRVYFEGDDETRPEAHGLAHISEAMLGINRMKKFSGTNKELAKKMILAHKGLRTSNGKRIMVRLRSQTAKNKGKLMRLSSATQNIVEDRAGKVNIQFDTDSDTSAPESDFQNLGSDSDTYKQHGRYDSSITSSSSSSSSSSDHDSNSSSGSGSESSDHDSNSSSGSESESSRSSSSSGSNSSGSESEDQDTEMSNSSGSDYSSSSSRSSSGSSSESD